MIKDGFVRQVKDWKNTCYDQYIEKIHAVLNLILLFKSIYPKEGNFDDIFNEVYKVK